MPTLKSLKENTVKSRPKAESLQVKSSKYFEQFSNERLQSSKGNYSKLIRAKVMVLALSILPLYLCKDA